MDSSAVDAFRAFRSSLYDCLRRRADALFELTDALLTAEAVPSPGPTFSPDGQTFFVNIQSPGITYAVWGPFKEPSAARQRQMAHADAPKDLRPRVSGELS